MACALSLHHFYTHAFHHPRHKHQPFAIHRRRHSYLQIKPLKQNPTVSVHLRAVPESQDPKLSIWADNIEPDVPNLPSHSSSDGRFWLSEAVKFDRLALEILSIALPAALALAADPIASLVNTAFVGRLGSLELATVGVSATVFNMVSKLFNIPLLNVTTSFVAEEQGLIRDGTIGLPQMDQDADVDGGQGKELLPSVSTSLALSAGIGFVEAVALFFGSGFLMNLLGVSVVLFSHSNSS